MADAQRIDPIERAKQDSAASRRANDINQRVRNKPFNKTRSALIYGLIAGVIVAAFQVFVPITDGGINIGLGVVGFALMTPVIWVALSKLKSYLAAGEFYKNAAIYSMYIAAIASVVSAVITAVAAGLLGRGDADGFMLATVAVFQVFVGIVIGNIIAFIIMQGMKSDVPEDEFIEKQV